MGVEVCDGLDDRASLLWVLHLGTKRMCAFAASIVIAVLNSNLSTSKLLLFDFWEYTNNPAHFLNSWVMTGVVECQPVPSTTAIASRLLEIFRDSGDSKMGRTCRLVCRDWSRVCAVHEPTEDWRVEDGVVWHWIETAWQVLPTQLWAWRLRPFSDEWWVDQRCHQQWIPKVIAI